MFFLAEFYGIRKSNQEMLRSSCRTFLPNSCIPAHATTIASLLGFEISALPFTGTFLLWAVFYTYHSSQCPQWPPFERLSCHFLIVTITFQLAHQNLALPWVHSFFIYRNSTLITSGFVQIPGTPFGLADSHFHYRIHSYPLRTWEIILAPRREIIRDSCLGRHVLTLRLSGPPGFMLAAHFAWPYFFVLVYFSWPLTYLVADPEARLLWGTARTFTQKSSVADYYFTNAWFWHSLPPVTSCYMSPAWTLSWPRKTHPLNTSKILASEPLFMLLLTQDMSSHPHFQILRSFSMFNSGPTSITRPPELISPCTEFSFL